LRWHFKLVGVLINFIMMNLENILICLCIEIDYEVRGVATASLSLLFNEYNHREDFIKRLITELSYFAILCMHPYTRYRHLSEHYLISFPF